MNLAILLNTNLAHFVEYNLFLHISPIETGKLGNFHFLILSSNPNSVWNYCK